MLHKLWLLADEAGRHSKAKGKLFGPLTCEHSPFLRIYVLSLVYFQ